MMSLLRKTWNRLLKNRLTISSLRVSGRYLIEKVFTIFCFLGCLFQLYHVTEFYLRFEVTTEISISIPRTLILPDISICVEDAQFMNLTKLNEKYPSLVEEMIAYDRGANQANVTSVHQLNESVVAHFVLRRLRINDTYDLMYPEEYLIKSWEIGTLTKQNSSLEEQGCRLRSRFTEFEFCITLGCSVKKPQVFTELENLRIGVGQPMFAVYLNTEALSRIENFYVGLLQHNALPRGNKIKFITLTTRDKPHTYPIEYHMFSTSLLPPPYVTGCKDYSAHNFDTLEHAREICLTNLSLTRFGVPFQKVLANPEWTHFFGVNLSLDARWNNTLREKLDEMYLECLAQTSKPNCYDLYYLTSQDNEEVTSGKDSYLDLRMPMEPYINTTCHPKQSLLEYLTFVGSIMGTWFGFNFAFSLRAMLDYVYSFSESLFNKKSSAIKVIKYERNLVGTSKLDKLNSSVDRISVLYTFYRYDGYSPRPKATRSPMVR